MKTEEILRRILEGQEIQEILKDDEAVNEINSTHFQVSLSKTLRAKAIAAIPQVLDKLIESALEGNQRSIAVLFGLLGMNLSQGVSESKRVEDIDNKINELLQKLRKE